MRARLSSVLIVVLVVGLMAGGAAAQTGRPSTLPAGGTVGAEVVADGLTAPVGLTPAGDGSDRLFVVDQDGLIHVIGADGELREEPFLDLRDRLVSLGAFYDERGLLGLAFHPDYAENGRFFVYYSAPLREGAPEGFDHTSRVSEFSVSADDHNRADPGSERIILEVDQPQSNHNAGELAFGPDDGLLYIALGDGGNANDVGLGHTPGIGNAQDISNVLGSILRIDVDGDEPYEIPDDNPFVGEEGRDEIFAHGFRNPWRFTFDPAGEHGLLVSDAGQSLWEEVSVVERGGNYGWNVKEGTHCFNPDDALDPPEDCPDVGPVLGDPLLDPVIEYPNASGHEDGVGVVVVGGQVYRGDELPQLEGRYVFADWSTSFVEPDATLMVAKPRPSGLWKTEELRVAGRPDGRLGEYVLGFGQDTDGEVYVLTSVTTGPTGETGRVYQLTNPGTR